MLATRYNIGKLNWSLVSFVALGPMVSVLMFGATKYSGYILYFILIYKFYK